MWGGDPWASVPYATLGGNNIFVAACIHTDLQLLYSCSVGVAVVHTCAVDAAIVYTISASSSVFTCDISGTVC